MATTTRNTATIIRSRQPHAGWLISGLSFALGLALVWLAVPRTLAAWAAFAAFPASLDVSWGRTPSVQSADAGIEGLQRAIRWSSSAEYLGNLGALELAKALGARPESPEQDQAALDSERHLTEALKLNPVDGLVWLRLAMARDLLHRSPREVVSCLVQSMDMAPNYRALWLVRTRMLISYWTSLTVEEGLTLRRQSESIWKAEPALREPLVALARDLNQVALLQWLIGPDEGVQSEFKKATIR